MIEFTRRTGMTSTCAVPSSSPKLGFSAMRPLAPQPCALFRNHNSYQSYELERAAVPFETLSIQNSVEFIAHPGGHVAATGRALDFLEQHLTRAIKSGEIKCR